MAEVGVTTPMVDMQNDMCGQQLALTGRTATDGPWSTSCTVPAALSVGCEVTRFARDQEALD